MTNADRIRKMTDEELLDKLDDLTACECCFYRKFHNKCYPDSLFDSCREGIMRWLKEECNE